MKNTKISLLVVLSLILTLGATSAFAHVGKDDKKKKRKRPKNTGTLSIQTTPKAMTVKVDGQVVGQSGVTEPAEFFLTPGVHLVEVEGPNGKSFTKEVNVVKNVKNCICLNIVETPVPRPCPYDIRVSGPDSVKDGDLATFIATNVATVSPVAASALNYKWRVTPSNARITSGLGTDAITVDTTGLGNAVLNVEVDVTDGTYDASCRQNSAVSTNVVVPVTPPPPSPPPFDEFVTVANDDDKARLDALAIELQNNPTAKGHIFIYQGTDKRSEKRTADRLIKFAFDYLTKTIGVDSSRLTIEKGGSRERTTYQMFLVPLGTPTPIPN